MTGARPLRGKTVVVTRPRAQAAGLCARLRAAGAIVLPIALIKIVPPPSYTRLDAALRRLDDCDAVVFTSGNAVSAVFARLRRLRLAAASPERVYAVGPKTAEALRRGGWKPRTLPQAYNGKALAEAMGKVRGLRILLPRAQKAGEELPRLLRAKGARLDIVTAYRTIGDSVGRGRLQRLARPDAVVFTSGSTVRAFLSALGVPAARKLFRTAAAVSIGPATSRELRRSGLSPVQAGQATDEGLCRVVVRRLS